MKKITIVILYSLILLGCKKEKPPIGKYIGYFSYVNSQGQNTTTSHSIEISESSKNSLVINGSTVSKNMRNIEGNTYISGLGNIVYLKGKWKKKFLSNNYCIEGTFIATYYQGGNNYNLNGTFTIKSDF
jgi:hypothetical protein